MANFPLEWRMKELVDVPYPNARRILVALDNLSTHRADRLQNRLIERHLRRVTKAENSY